MAIDTRPGASPMLDQLRRGARAAPEDPDALYRLAVFLMNPAELRRPTKRHRVRARDLLERAIRVRPAFGEAHALLAHVLLELDEPDDAIEVLRRTVDLRPGDAVAEDFLLETLDRAGRTRDLRGQLGRIAARRGADLASLRADLREAGLPTDPSTIRLNAFPAGERHFLSALVDAAEAIEREASPSAGGENELAAQAARRAVKIDARRVPADLRSVVELARNWGIPDDAHRGLLVARASARERAEMRRALPARTRRRIVEWIDGFSDAASMTPEAVHFMYLLEAHEEM